MPAPRDRNAVLRAAVDNGPLATALHVLDDAVGARELLRTPRSFSSCCRGSLRASPADRGASRSVAGATDMTGSAFQLGMVGLVQFLPTALLVFVAGHAADRFERKRVVQLCQIAEAATALFLAVSTFAGWLTVPQIFIATFVIGIAGAFESPATAALLPLIAPKARCSARPRSPPARRRSRPSPARARRARLCVRAEPALFVIVAFWLCGAVLTGFIHTDKQELRSGCDADDVFAGVRFIPQQPGDPRHHLASTCSPCCLAGVTALLPDLCARHP
jgi:hypothetical protein